MAQLIVRKLDDRLVKRLKHRAADHGISMEEEHRRILKEILAPKPRRKRNLKDILVSPPYFSDEIVAFINDRKRDKPRRIDLK